MNHFSSMYQIWAKYLKTCGVQIKYKEPKQKDEQTERKTDRRTDGQIVDRRNVISLNRFTIISLANRKNKSKFLLILLAYIRRYLVHPYTANYVNYKNLYMATRFNFQYFTTKTAIEQEFNIQNYCATFGRCTSSFRFPPHKSIPHEK